MKDKVFKTLDTQIQADEAQRRMTFTISTGAVDRDGDTLDPKGWDLKNYLKNPAVLFAHDYHSLPVAKTVEIKNTDTALVATVEFPAKGVHPFADTVHDMLKSGFLSATSVGFRALEHEPATDRKGYNFKKQELLEFSVVPIPANPEALISQRHAGSPDDVVKNWCKQIVDWSEKANQTPAKKRLKALLPSFVPSGKDWDAFEQDYTVESEEKELTDARVCKLLDLHGFKDQAKAIKGQGVGEPASADAAQREAMKKIHNSAMDAYANAHHAHLLLEMMRTTGGEDLKAISGKHSQMINDAHGAVGRAKDHAKASAESCASMGKAFDYQAKLVTEEELKAKYAETDEDWWIELEDEKDGEFDVDDKQLAELIGASLATHIADQTRAAINKALGRLD